jgi:hypothetical protein
VNVLCGSENTTLSSSEKSDFFASIDSRRPSLTAAVLSRSDLRAEICDLSFFLGPEETSGETSPSGEKRGAESDSERERRRRSHLVHKHAGGGVAPQLDKFIMFFTDSFPHNYGKDLFPHFESHSQVYLINIPGAKYSHAIYTSFMTGQVATNYEGKTIDGDHLVRSMKRSFVRPGVDSRGERVSYPVRYYGPEWSLLAIFGNHNYGTFFNAGVHVQSEALDINFIHPYPFFFEDQKATDLFRGVREDIAAKGQSVFVHTGVMDHRQHGEHLGLGPSGKAFPHTDTMAARMVADLKTVKSFVDRNPEYLLVLISDHGVDEFDYAGYRMHGLSENGNEPFMLVYNPRLPHRGPKWLDVVDIASTLGMFLRGVDIPINSLGVPQTYFGETDGARRAEVGSLKQSLLQLNKVAYSRGVHVDQDELMGLITKPFASGNSTQVADLRRFAERLKEDLYTVVVSPWVEIGVLAVFATLDTLLVLLMFNGQCTLFVVARDVHGVVSEFMKLAVIYCSCFLQLMFCWWNWGIAADGGFVYICVVRSRSFPIFFHHQYRSSDTLFLFCLWGLSGTSAESGNFP